MQPIIKVENLGKSYIIGHQRERYVALRDVLTNKARQVVSKTKNLLSGGQLIAGNELEEFWALKDINFEVNQGDRVGIIGRNGAGKSTLLKVLSRITEPTTGRIRLKGRVASLLEVGTGFHPELSGRENIYLNGAILGMKQAEVRKKFDEIVDFAGVEKFLDTPVKRYSSGMYVRLAFAVAAHLEPEILIIDEVLAVGDAEFQKKCLGKMEDVSKNEGRTVLFVSHNMGAIASLCNRGILLTHGEIVKHENSVTALIQFYLNESINIQNINLWERNSNKFDNEYFSPYKFYISNSYMKQEEGVLSNNDDYYINIEANISKIDIALTIGYAVFDESNNCIFWSYQTDSKKENWPLIKTPGNYTLKSSFPKRLLNEGKYRIELIGGLHYIKWLFEPQKSNPYFFIEINGGLSDSPYYTHKRESIIAPIFNWEILTK